MYNMDIEVIMQEQLLFTLYYSEVNTNLPFTFRPLMVTYSWNLSHLSTNMLTTS